MKHLIFILVIAPTLLFSQGWEKTYNLNLSDIGYSVQQTTDGGYIITGIYGINMYYVVSKVFLIKTDSYGDTLWTKTYDPISSIGYSVQQTTDGGYIISGQSGYVGGGSSDVYLIKTDENGTVTFTTEILIPNPNKKLVKMIDLSGKEILKPKKNQPYIEIYEDGTAEKKINIR